MFDFNNNKEWKNDFFDEIRCESQCTENEEIFNFGEMDVDSAK